MSVTKPFAAPWHAAWAQRPLSGGSAPTAADILLTLVWTAATWALCKSFLHWLHMPVDSYAFIALALIAGFVASFCWFLRLVLRLVVLPRLRARKSVYG